MSMSIFVVEDDPSLRTFIQRWLAQLTHQEVMTFATGTAAVEALHAFAPTLLVSDLEMPGLSGEEVAEAAAQLSNPPRIVLMSGDHDRLRRAGSLAQATLAKPFTFRELRSSVPADLCLER
jgi:DNA-binding response OmpR family regulator